MYSVVLATVLLAGGEATAFGRHGGCHGCHGSSGYAFSNGCHGGCHGCWGGGGVSVGAFQGGHGCWGSSCYGCHGGGCYGSSFHGSGGAGFAFYSGCHGFGGTSCYGNYAGGFGCFGGNDVIVAMPAFTVQPQAVAPQAGGGSGGSGSSAEQGPRPSKEGSPEQGPGPSKEGNGGRELDAIRREVRETNNRLDSLQQTVNRLAEQLGRVPAGGPGAPPRRQ